MAEARQIIAIKVSRNVEYNEYVVRAYIGPDGFHRHPDADYYTNDKDDAIATARSMLGVPQSTKPARIGKYYTAADLV